MVFFSSCNSVKYHAELLNYVDITVKDIHGKQKQQKRTATFFEFCQAETGVLLCTDVAARGLDIPGAPPPLPSPRPVQSSPRAVAWLLCSARGTAAALFVAFRRGGCVDCSGETHEMQPAPAV